MNPERIATLSNLINKKIDIAKDYLSKDTERAQNIKTLLESEIPGFETKPMKFGQFVEKDFVAMMTDIRRSTDIINSNDGTIKMFLIFYAYSAVVANIVNLYDGTSTEFLGDGVLNLFEADVNKNAALTKSYAAAHEILDTTVNIMNPIFIRNALPEIVIGIGIDFGNTIVTRFGDKQDNDLKAFGKCVYHVSRLCKGINEIVVSLEAQRIWPSGPGGRVKFEEKIVEGKTAYKAYRI